MSETSTKPYLIRALHEWCTDNGYTPFLAVTVDERVAVPREHVKDGEIVLNVGRLATSKLDLGNEYIEFQARFGGVARQISVPVDAVTAIYARETGHGMAFEATPPAAKRPVGIAGAADEDGTMGSADGDTAADHGARPALTAVPAADDDTPGASGDDDTDPPSPPSPEKGRPRLTVIK
ncbi:ClpXP protease specificity-enhancing factor [Pigmentiphaga litoralis]|uniref:ClpXP protease specificity-enhancing factor n=1 Tax=Pigmentiphaga litoralis TaxID=516702 RepID=UPI003B438734